MRAKKWNEKLRPKTGKPERLIWARVYYTFKRNFNRRIIKIIFSSQAQFKSSFPRAFLPQLGCVRKPQADFFQNPLKISQQPELLEQLFVQTHKHSVFCVKVLSRVFLPSTLNHGIRLCQQETRNLIEEMSFEVVLMIMWWGSKKLIWVGKKFRSEKNVIRLICTSRAAPRTESRRSEFREQSWFSPDDLGDRFWGKGSDDANLF